MQIDIKSTVPYVGHYASSVERLRALVAKKVEYITLIEGVYNLGATGIELDGTTLIGRKDRTTITANQGVTPIKGKNLFGIIDVSVSSYNAPCAIVCCTDMANGFINGVFAEAYWDNLSYSPLEIATGCKCGFVFGIGGALTVVGDSTTRFDITNPSGYIYRYTWDGTGTDPNINTTTFPMYRTVFINAQNFAAVNNGIFRVTGSGTNYFEVTNYNGQEESDKTIGTGEISYGGATVKIIECGINYKYSGPSSGDQAHCFVYQGENTNLFVKDCFGHPRRAYSTVRATGADFVNGLIATTIVKSNEGINNFPYETTWKDNYVHLMTDSNLSYNGKICGMAYIYNSNKKMSVDNSIYQITVSNGTPEMYGVYTYNDTAQNTEIAVNYSTLILESPTHTNKNIAYLATSYDKINIGNVLAVSKNSTDGTFELLERNENGGGEIAGTWFDYNASENKNWSKTKRMSLYSKTYNSYTTIASIPIFEGNTIYVSYLVMGEQTTHVHRCCFEVKGLFYRNTGGNVTQVGGSSIIMSVRSDNAYASQLYANTTSQSIDIQVKSRSGNIVNWDITYTYTKRR